MSDFADEVQPSLSVDAITSQTRSGPTAVLGPIDEQSTQETPEPGAYYDVCTTEIFDRWAPAG